MDKRKILYVIVVMLMLSLTVYKFNINRINKNKEVDKVRVIDTKEENNMFAFMIQGDDGKYTQSNNNIWPGEGYKINADNTKCMDNNGVEVKNGITYNAAAKIVTVTSSNTSYCYLYFDTVGKGGLDIVEKLPTSSGLSSSKLGDMRRYQGTDVKNYICINDTGTKCNSGTDEMYRIIGIVDDGADEGQIKVIKETKYGDKYMWNTNYQASQCSGTTCSWPNNDLAKTLNTTFLNSLPDKVQDKIVSRQWYYGDLEYEYEYVNADVMYQIETGQINTGYYDAITGKHITTEKWQKTSESKKIGLMYIHDYGYAANSHATSCRMNYDTCKSSWIHLSQNNNTSDAEWTMSRIGGNGNSSSYVFAWHIISNGSVVLEDVDYKFAVRPVFYLSSDVKIKSGGTGEKTNPYILDLS